MMTELGKLIEECNAKLAELGYIIDSLVYIESGKKMEAELKVINNSYICFNFKPNKNEKTIIYTTV